MALNHTDKIHLPENYMTLKVKSLAMKTQSLLEIIILLKKD